MNIHSIFRWKSLLVLLLGLMLLTGCADEDAQDTSQGAASAASENAPAPEPVQREGRDDAITAMTAEQLQAAMAAGELTAAAVTEAFLERIARLDSGPDGYNAVLEVNPQALQIAKDLDARRAAGQKPGLMFGVPVLVKANIDTADQMATSAGSTALAGHKAARDAHVVAKLRAAGAVILGKTNLSEWANFRSTKSSSGWSSLGGQTRNAWKPGANPCGSSSGSAVAVAVRLAPLALGTETNGSIVCPAGANGVLGLKPTMGRVSRSGVIPIADSMDMVGPMARNAADIAMIMRVIDGRDENDRVTTVNFKRYNYIPPTFDGTLKGMRIGVWRNYPGAGTQPEVDALYDEVIAQIGQLGAEIIDPIEMETGDLGAGAYGVMLYEFRQGLNQYLANVTAPGAPKTLDQLIKYNNSNAEQVLAHFDQDIFEAAAAVSWTPNEYAQQLAAVRRDANLQIEKAIRSNALTHIISVTNGPAWPTDWENGDRYTIGSSTLPAIAGHPHLTVPMGLVDGLPIGLSIINARVNEFRGTDLAAAIQATRGELSPL